MPHSERALTRCQHRCSINIYVEKSTPELWNKVRVGSPVDILAYYEQERMRC